MPPAGSIHAARIRGGIVLLPPLTGAVSELRQQSGCSLSVIRNRQKQHSRGERWCISASELAFRTRISLQPGRG